MHVHLLCKLNDRCFISVKCMNSFTAHNLLHTLIYLDVLYTQFAYLNYIWLQKTLFGHLKKNSSEQNLCCNLIFYNSMAFTHFNCGL